MKGPTNSSARPNIRLLNVSATFESNPDTSNNTEFPYRASIQADGVSEYMSATVMFSQIQATSGNFATYCQTDEDVIYIYAKTNPTPNEGDTITIPAVSCDLSVNYINIDSTPTEDSQAVITSGGVYDNCVRTSGNQNVDGTKVFKKRIYTQDIVTPGVADTKSSNVYMDNAGLSIQDKNNVRVSYLVPILTTNNKTIVELNSYDGTNSSVLQLYSDGYVTAPNRSYNPSHTHDVVTIGSLTPSTTSVTSKMAYYRTGNIVQVTAYDITIASGSSVLGSGLPRAIHFVCAPIATNDLTIGGYAQVDYHGTQIQIFATRAISHGYIGFTYITDE